MKHWGVLSLVLQYPDAELVAAQDELERAAAGSTPIARFLGWQRDVPLRELRSRYVETFDFDRRASLHLTYHTHGDRRERGIALVAPEAPLRGGGLPLTGDELPDYLPVLLEFAALAPDEGEAAADRAARAARARPLRDCTRSRARTPTCWTRLSTTLPKPTKAQVDAARRLADQGPPTELVGLEPFTAEVPR